MKDFTRKFESWAQELIKYHTLLKPILDIPYIGDSSFNKINEEIAQLNISESITDIVNEIMFAFLKVNADQRLSISELINENDTILWALKPFEQPTNIEDIENQMLWFIILDQGKDTRDAILALNEIISITKSLGFNVNTLLKKYVSLASIQDKFGWGSTQNLILRSIK